MDMNATPRHGEPLWSETRWVACWNPEAGVGIWVHAGRFPDDLDMWWKQTVAYLPDGQVCVDRSWGRNSTDAGLKSGPLDLEIVENGWRCGFDGVGQIASASDLARAPRGSSAPVRSMWWEVTAAASASEWDMYAGRENESSIVGDTHVEQGYRTTGTLRVGGREFGLDGIGFKDHSSGIRRIGRWRSHCFMLIVADGWTAHLIALDDPQGNPAAPWGTYFDDSGQHPVTTYDLDRVRCLDGGPVKNDVVFETANGVRHEFVAELAHCFPATITAGNDNFNGIDWDLPEDTVAFFSGMGRLSWPDGTQAHCYFERSMPRRLLEPLPGAAGTR
jgi:hypothetical protein